MSTHWRTRASALTTLALSSALLAGCSGDTDAGAPNTPNGPQKPTVDCTDQTLSQEEWVKHCADPDDAPAQPKGGVQNAKIGKPVTVYGALGSEIKMTLTGVAYADAQAKDADTDNPYVVAYAFTLEAATTDHLGAPVDGAEFRWAKGTDKFTDMDTTDAPWVGCTNAYSVTEDLLPGEPFHAITETYATAKGGTLTYTDGSGTVIRWKLPDSDTGTGTEPATKYVTEYC